MKFQTLIPFTFLASALFALNTQAASVENFDGSYDVEFTVQTPGQPDTIYHDEMILQGVNGPISTNKFQRIPIQGEMRVPNSFTSPLTGFASLQLRWSGTSATFQFEILADENGSQYKVYYAGGISPGMFEKFIQGQIPPTIIGQVYVDEVSGEKNQKKQIGTFKAVRREERSL